MRQWSLRTRLIALVIGATLVTTAIGALALWANDRVADRMGALQERRMKGLVSLDIVGRGLERQRATVLATLAATNELMVEALEKQAAVDATRMPAALATLRQRAADDEERKLLDALGAAIAKSREGGLRAVLGLLQKGQFIEADVAAQSLYRPQVDAATRALDEVISAQVRLAEADYREAAAFVEWQALLTLVAISVALVLGMILAKLIAKALQGVLGAHEVELASGARHFAEGRLDHRIDLFPGDNSSVASSLNQMGEGFSSLVAGVAAGAERVADGSERLSNASRDLSTRTGSQAASLEQTAAAMEQLAVTVRQNSERAVRARALATDAAQTAAQGGEAVRAAVGTMRGVSESSQRIGEIVAVIDGIAFQTNILALNAAVEAARAGEHGRGFAVVAAEVRALSQRSSGAAREIRTLIDASVGRIEEGRRLVEHAGATIEDIVTTTRNSTQIVADIAAASEEQAAGILQVNRALLHLEGVTQGNASLAGDTAAQAHEMAALAEGLVEAVGRFSPGHFERDANEAIWRAAMGSAARIAAPAVA